MKKDFIKEFIVYSLLPYIFCIFIAYSLYINNLFDHYFPYVFMGIIALLLKDYLIYIHDINNVSVNILNRKKINNNKVSIGKKIILYTHAYIFPISLCLYLFIIMGEQIRGYDLGVYKNTMLFIALGFGIISTLGDEFIEKYYTVSTKLLDRYIIIAVIFLCSVASGYLSLYQLISLGFVAYLMSFLISILIFTIGLDLVSEKNNS